MKTEELEFTTGLRFQDVIRKARFGHREWIYWKDKMGQRCASRLTADAMKRCLLDVGTQGNWSLLCTDGTAMKGYFWLGIIQLSRIRHGLLNGSMYTEDRDVHGRSSYEIGPVVLCATARTAAAKKPDALTPGQSEHRR